MADTPQVIVVEPGSPDDPFTQAASDAVPTPSTTPAVEPGKVSTTVLETPADGVPAAVPTPTIPEPDAAELAQLSPEDQEFIKDLYAQARKELEDEVVPRIQSGYDRREAALQRQITTMQEAASKREAELQSEIRDRMLAGLTPEEQDKLRAQWDVADERAKLDEMRIEVEAYHKSVFIADCIQRFPELELTVEELDTFPTPELIESAIKDAMIDYYREGGQATPAPGAAAAAAATTTPAAAAPAATVPAGVNANTDAGGGSAVPQVSKFDDTPGKSAMVSNLGDPNAWETVRFRGR